MNNILRTLIGMAAAAAGIASAALPNPLIFVTQTPNQRGISDIGTVTGTFTTHLPSMEASPRGGSLFILYPDGTLKDLMALALQEACASGRPTCDANGVFKTNGSGVLTNGYTLRDPTVHWDGNKVLFSALKGVVTQQFGALPAGSVWQMYEISNLGQAQTPILTKVANQPATYNNVSPIYGSDDKIIFTTDRPITGKAIHYPQIEEYESGPTVSGLWKLDPATGTLTLMDHSPSGMFTPFLDSFGQVIFTRWDHMQQDQQAMHALAKVLGQDYEDWDPYTYYHEDDFGADKRQFVEDFVRQKLSFNTMATDLQAYGLGETVVPEYNNFHAVLTASNALSRNGQNAGTITGGRTIKYFTPTNKYGRYDGLRFNLFLPWQINQDGTGHETFRHFGRHELTHFINRTYMDDPALADLEGSGDLSPLARRDGYFTVVETPTNLAGGAGTYIGIGSPEFDTHVSGFILQMRDTLQSISENGAAVTYTKLTDPNSTTNYRNPIRLTDGTYIASVDEVPTTQKGSISNPFLKIKFRLYTLKAGPNGFLVPDAPLLPTGITRSFSYWDPDALRTFNNRMWEITPVEVRARARPPMTQAGALPSPEAAAFATAGVDINAFKQYLRDNDLALIVARDVTRRDENDVQQPLNLRIDAANVPAGKTAAQTRKTGQGTARLYDISKLQIFQNDLIRSYGKYAEGSGASLKDNGRRGLARPVHHAGTLASNPTLPGFPGVKLGHDGSFAAFVPAKRAITWVMADRDEVPVVRERYWLTFAAGEVRVCASCHGINNVSQSGGSAATTTPQALIDLLDYWKRSDTGATSVITHYYQTLLRRAPDAAGLSFWEDTTVRLRSHGGSSNEALYALSASFLTSAEYAAFNRDNTGFVTDLYNAFFNRAPDSGGLAFWVDRLNQGMPREVVYVSFLFSAEFDLFTRGVFGSTTARAEIDTVFDFYRGLLGRVPDSAGLDGWLREFRKAQCNGSAQVLQTAQSIANSFANSAEYTNRNRSNAQYVGDLYNSFLRRGGDLAGVQFWVNKLNNNEMNRAEVRANFVASPEFQTRVSRITSEACLL